MEAEGGRGRGSPAPGIEGAPGVRGRRGAPAPGRALQEARERRAVGGHAGRPGRGVKARGLRSASQSRAPPQGGSPALGMEGGGAPHRASSISASAACTAGSGAGPFAGRDSSGAPAGGCYGAGVTLGVRQSPAPRMEGGRGRPTGPVPGRELEPPLLALELGARAERGAGRRVCPLGEERRGRRLHSRGGTRPASVHSGGLPFTARDSLPRRPRRSRRHPGGSPWPRPSIRGAGLDPRQSTAGTPFHSRRGAGLTPASGARAASPHVSSARVPPREWRGAPGLCSGPSGAAPPPPGSPAAWSGSSARVAYIMYRCERAGRGVRARGLRSARQSPAPGSPAPRMDRGHGGASPGRGAPASSAGRRSPFLAGIAGRRTPTPRRGGPPFGGGTPRVSQPRASPFAARDSPRRRGPRRTAPAATCRSGRTAATGPRSAGG